MKEKIVFVEVSCLIELSYMMKKKHVSEMLLPSKTITLSYVKIAIMHNNTWKYISIISFDGVRSILVYNVAAIVFNDDEGLGPERGRQTA